MAFPSSLPSYAGFTSSETLQTAGHAGQHNAEQTDITAIATKLGTGASTPTSTSVLIGNGAGTSTWGLVNLTNQVSGVLPTGNGGTGTASTTGTGSVVYSNSPTLASPTITNPTESGGTYNTATLNSPTIATPSITYNNNSIPNTAIDNNSITNSQIANGGINFANLLSSIFSGQVSTQANAGSAGGTMYYINLGGIKLLWGTSATGLASGAGYTWTLPTSFFSTLQLVQPGTYIPSGVVTQYQIIQTASTTTITVYNIASSGSGSVQQSLLVIGT